MSDDDKLSLSERIKGSRVVRAAAHRALARLDRRDRDADKRGVSQARKHASRLWALERLDLFNAVPRERLATLAHRVRATVHERRQSLVLEDAGSTVFAVTSGGAKLCRDGRLGRRLVEAVVGPGDVFGGIASSEADGVYVLEPLELTQLLRVPRDAFEALLREVPELAYEVVQMLEHRQRRLLRRVTSLAFKDVPSRVAETLLELIDEHGEGCGHGFAVDVRITQQDLGQLVGASRQMVNRALGELGRRLVVQRMGPVLCVLDRRRLERFAEGTLD